LLRRERSWRLRSRTWGGHRTTGRGIIRLGTYIEPLPRHYAKFKELFPERRYFLLTRGLNPMSMYREVEADPLALNIQVSVDSIPTGLPFADGKSGLVPSEGRLRELLTLKKAYFRLKTTSENAAVLAGLGIPRGRVIETPLRAKKWAYGRATPLEKLGWHYREFLRCNTPCSDCVRENAFVACLVTPHMDPSKLNYGPPPRESMYLDVPWKQAICDAISTQGEMKEIDGKAMAVLPLARIYEYVLAHYPAVVYKPTWKFRVRVAVQLCAVNAGRGMWGLPMKAVTAPLTSFRVKQ